MYIYGRGAMTGWGWLPVTLGMIVFWGLLIAAGVALFRHLARSGRTQPDPVGQPPSPQLILAERYARGEIDEDEYTSRLATLHGAGIS
jgi:putative membrane protein